MLGEVPVLGLAIYGFIVAAYIAVPIFVGYIAWRFVRAFERRSRTLPELEQLRERLTRVEEATGLIGDRVDSLAEEHHFLTRVVGSRPANGDVTKP
jgi:hypothetical protein